MEASLKPKTHKTNFFNSPRLKKLYEAMKDGKYHSNIELAAATGSPCIGTNLFDLKRCGFEYSKMERHHSRTHKEYWYRLDKVPSQKVITLYGGAEKLREPPPPKRQVRLV